MSRWPQINPIKKAKAIELYSQDHSITAISKMLNLKNSTVHSICCRCPATKVRGLARDVAVVKPTPKLISTQPVREMPPTNPPGPITVIHADCVSVEQGIIAKYGRKLKPVVCALSSRKPAMNFNIYASLPT